jgi:GNAT superfamily N-acetyltransferase
MTVQFRNFDIADTEEVYEVFESNYPQYFGDDDRVWLNEFFEQPDGPNFVVEHNDRVIGFGGYEISKHYNKGVLTFGMVHRDFHKKGIGKLLLAYRILHIAEHEQDTHYVWVDTTPEISGFFEYMGFQLISVFKKGYRSGFDMHLLRYDITAQTIPVLKAILNTNTDAT